MHCSICSRAVVTIQLTINGEDVTLNRCAPCDTRVWAGPTGEITRDGVLELVRSSR